MKITVMSRERCLKHMQKHGDSFRNKEFSVISINDPANSVRYPGVYEDSAYGYLFDPPETDNVTSLCFHDVGYDFLREEYIHFNAEMADKILDFLEKHDRSKDLIVHCYAGIARSGAVGEFAREYFNLDFQKFCETNRQIVPNSLVGAVLRKQWAARCFRTKTLQEAEREVGYSIVWVDASQ